VVRQYHRRRFLGKGGFAKCFEVEGVDSHRLAAMKIISKETLKKSKAKQKVPYHLRS
jgi:polo-like kinase 1